MGAANCTCDSRSVTRSQISRSSPMGEGILHSQSNVSASDDITQTIRSPSLVANRSRAKYRARALSTATPANPNHPGYRPEIDGLRALAVTSVIGFHAFPNAVRGGFIGVDIFFVISGYLITNIIGSSLRQGNFSVAEFYARRIKRIFPALLVVLSACFAFGWFTLFSDELEKFGKHVAGGAGFVSNLVLWNESGYFDADAESKPLLHLWSLGIEEQFYFFWPLALL